jgi:hypothetical protein
MALLSPQVPLRMSTQGRFSNLGVCAFLFWVVAKPFLLGCRRVQEIAATMLPINLIAVRILPFVQYRSTWNSLCCANKELRKAGKKMRPPWPHTCIDVPGTAVMAVAFSPCKAFLVCGSSRGGVHFWDRQGKHTQLEGHTAGVTCLQYSSDGKYLASGSLDDSIRLWPLNTKSADPGSLAGDIKLLWNEIYPTALAFSPTDSNLLASGFANGGIKLWDAINRVCIHSFENISIPNDRAVTAIHFCPGDNIQCYVTTQGDTTQGGEMIRIVRNEMMEFTANILQVPSLGKYGMVAFPPSCVTRFAAIWYTWSKSRWELALFDDSIPMAKTQSVFLSCTRDEFRVQAIAMSPDCKKLATTTDRYGGTRIFECQDLIIQKDALEQAGRNLRLEGMRYLRFESGPVPIVFDPTSQCVAVGCSDGRVELTPAT